MVCNRSIIIIIIIIVVPVAKKEGASGIMNIAIYSLFT